MIEQRLENGVLMRLDGGGDAWASEHRSMLPRCWYLSDTDQTHRQILEIENHENRTFSENVLDSYENRGKIIRSCATLCRIDRKKSVDVARAHIKAGKPALVALLQDCRNDRQLQGGLGGRCFLVCGTGYPFVYIEVDPMTGEEIGEHELNKNDSWNEFYKRIGLTDERMRIESFLLHGAT